MTRSYLAVINAYCSSLSFLFVSGMLAFFLVISFLGANPYRLSAWPVLPILLTWSTFAGSMAGLTKEHFITPLARIVPGFARHHIIVATVMSVLACALTAGVLSATTSAQFIASCSVLTVMYAFLGWGACLQPVILIVFAGLMYVFCCTMHVDLAVAILQGQNSAATVILLFLSIAWLILLGWRLSHLTEEDRAYSQHFWNPRARRESFGRLTPDQQRAISKSWFLRLKERRLDEVLARPARGLWANARRLRRAGQSCPSVVIAVALLGGSWLTAWLLTPEAIITLQMAPMASIVILSCWRNALPSLSQEAMHPVTRNTLLKQIGLLMLIDVVKYWGAVAALTAVAWSLLTPQHLTDLRWYYLFGVALLGIPLFVGLAALTLTIHSNIAFWAGTMVIYTAAMVAVVAIGKDSLDLTHHAFAIWAIGLLVAGSLVCSLAYRVWLHADLE